MTKVDIGRNFLAHKVFKAKEREDLAKKGQAMPSGGFPIRNRLDLKNAIQAFGRAKNKAAAKAHIIKRAKALGLTDLLPEGWSESTEHMSSFRSFLEHHGVKGQRWGVRRSRRQLSRAAKSRGKSVKDMNDQELRDLVNRMNLEQQYSRLSGSGRGNSLASNGLKFVGSIGANIARTQITNAANAQIAKALSR